jgi:hypothetical protein
MTIDTTTTALPPAGGATDPATAAATRRAASEAARKEEIATIKEKGFSTYVKEMEEEKIKKMREKILEAMGLTEEDLLKMDPKARAAVEQGVSTEIQKRLAATSGVNAEGKGQDRAAAGQMLMEAAQGRGAAIGASLSGALSGLGRTATEGATRTSLLTLQEAAPETADGGVTDVKDSRERGRGLPV